MLHGKGTSQYPQPIPPLSFGLLSRITLETTAIIKLLGGASQQSRHLRRPQTRARIRLLTTPLLTLSLPLDPAQILTLVQLVHLLPMTSLVFSVLYLHLHPQESRPSQRTLHF